MRLGAVVERLELEGLLLQPPAADVELLGIADDSRRVRAGDLFCAWAGTAVDGHGYLAAAKTAGAAAALVERRVEESELPQVVVSDGRRAAAMAASVVFADPGAKLLLVAV
ncbi:MAG: UDP-N-acetylmuramoyl-L-alanyl-D-glutamate--2,6-diaminopimelate ligase, partial [Gemmatimonadetes bacterium]|nr:UDP-N-acetylmuramoyl-L-alanyl-D-glutamate--2,6-diaminopimelate ligase [Gemmatimonadota bacterium]